jgi:hypothetical protein
MPTMQTRQRLFALVATLAVAFGALWPLVSAARPATAAIPNFICTQSGFQHPGDVPAADDGFHCPLCVFSIDAAPPRIVPVATVHAPFATPRMGAFTSSLHLAFFARPPPSHAPPLS